VNTGVRRVRKADWFALCVEQPRQSARCRLAADHTMNSERHPAAFLCGDLNMLRCFADFAPHVVVLSSDDEDVTFLSKYCKERRIIASVERDPESALVDLERLAEGKESKPVLFYGTDAMLLLLSRNRARLGSRFSFLMPSESMVEALVDKTSFAELAPRAKIPVPRTLSSHDVRTIREIERELSFPCVLKPKQHTGWSRSEAVRAIGGRPRKAFRADSRRDLERLYPLIREFTTSFVIQEYVPGGDDCLYSFHAYLDSASRPLGHYVGRKIRTYPKDSGVSTYLELVVDDEVSRAGLDILRKLGHVGIAKLDFKRHKETGKLYLLEINPRFNLWNYLGSICGINLPQIAYYDHLGERRPRATRYRTGTRWLSFGDDLRTFLREYRRSGDLSWSQWLGSYRGPKVYDVFAWDDPYPFGVAALRDLKSRARRVFRVGPP
jgi:D-aspartate ligase